MLFSIGLAFMTGNTIDVTVVSWLFYNGLAIVTGSTLNVAFKWLAIMTGTTIGTAVVRLVCCFLMVWLL